MFHLSRSSAVQKAKKNARKKPFKAQFYRFIKKEGPVIHIIYFIAPNYGLKLHLRTGAHELINSFCLVSVQMRRSIPFSIQEGPKHTMLFAICRV